MERETTTLTITNKEILKLIEIAKSQGFKTSTEEDENNVIINFEHSLKGSEEDFNFFIGVSEDADAEEISDQLFLLLDTFQEEVEEGNLEIPYLTYFECFRLVQNLFREHLCYRNNY